MILAYSSVQSSICDIILPLRWVRCRAREINRPTSRDQVPIMQSEILYTPETTKYKKVSDRVEPLLDHARHIVGVSSDTYHIAPHHLSGAQPEGTMIIM